MEKKPNFFDGRTLGAIAVVFVVWLGWQYYMQQKYPHLFEEVKKEESVVRTPEKEPLNESAKITPPESASGNPKRAELQAAEPPIEAQKETVLVFESPNLSFDISSQGMGIRNIRLNKYTDRQGAVIRVGSPDADRSTFATSFLGQRSPISFELTKIDDRIFVGRSQWGELEIVKKVEVIAARYEIKTQIEIKGSHPNFIGFSTAIVDQVVPVQGGSFFTPQYERQEFYVAADDTTERVHVADENESRSFSKLILTSFGSQYFTQAFVNKSEVLPELKVEVTQATKLARALINYQNLDGKNFTAQFTSFVGPKDVELLRAVHPELDNVVDFGWFSWIAKYILVFLKVIYQFVGNWGVAIVLLTMAVRILVLPFNLMSYKSMKVMQVLQPEMKAIREKYKDDQQKMNQEIMALMKTHKANPLGGCLPMLLQFPIFIALYQVLGHSIELYQAPFAFWIHDLSAKDPYYVLPVLMGATLFVQTKITPSTMDPAQAKVMMFMPLLFSFFMLSLPSGLTLYIFVSGVFGVLQQLYFMKFNQVDTPASK